LKHETQPTGNGQGIAVKAQLFKIILVQDEVSQVTGTEEMNAIFYTGTLDIFLIFNFLFCPAVLV